MIRISRSLQILILLLTFVVALPAFAEDDVLKNLSYPELEVTPLASARVLEEARLEKKQKWTRHWPLQVSALSTLLASGAIKDKVENTADATEKKRNEDAAKVGGIVGLAWLGTTVALSMTYNPNLEAYRATKKMPAGTKREKLAKERLAETHLRDAASFGAKLTWMSFATNLLASVNMAANTNEDGQIASGLAILLSATPIIFQYRWMKVDDEHQMYKKKIYGPVAQTSVFPDASGRIATGVTLRYSF